MRNINLRYVDETYAPDGQLETFSVHYPDNFNFGYDIVDDIAMNDPDRRAMIWCNPEGEEHIFTFADMKRWSDKTANFLVDQASSAVITSLSSCADTTSSGSSRRRWPKSARSWSPLPSC